MSDERARVLTLKEMSKNPEAGNEFFEEVSQATEYDRPKTRLECVDGPRPCPYISCQHHLYLDVTEAGAIKINFPGVDLLDMLETCALDVADRGLTTLEDVGNLMNLTRERTRQIEAKALSKLKIALREDVPKRHLPVLSEDSRG